MTKEERRKLMPTIASWIDAMREYFPDLRIDYASENGHAWGQRQEGGVPVSEMVWEKKA